MRTCPIYLFNDITLSRVSGYDSEIQIINDQSINQLIDQEAEVCVKGGKLGGCLYLLPDCVCSPDCWLMILCLTPTWMRLLVLTEDVVLTFIFTWLSVCGVSGFTISLSHHTNSCQYAQQCKQWCFVKFSQSYYYPVVTGLNGSHTCSNVVRTVKQNESFCQWGGSELNMRKGFNFSFVVSASPRSEALLTWTWARDPPRYAVSHAQLEEILSVSTVKWQIQGGVIIWVLSQGLKSICAAGEVLF